MSCAVSALILLFLDGVYISGKNGTDVRFRRIKAPTSKELTQLTRTIAHRVARHLERQDLLVRDADDHMDVGGRAMPGAIAENSYLTGNGVDADSESPMNRLLGSSITYRIALGPQQGRKVFTLQTLPDCESDSWFADTVGKVGGFSLHAGVANQADERKKVRAGTAREAALGHKLERLCRYVARPAVSTKRLSMTGPSPPADRRMPWPEQSPCAGHPSVGACT